MLVAALWSAYPVTDTRQFFDGDPACGAFSVCHGAFGDLVVDVGGESRLFATPLLQQSPRRTGFLGLQPLTQPRLPLAIGVQARTGRFLTGAGGRDVDDAHVHAGEPVRGLADRGFRGLDGGVEKPFAISWIKSVSPIERVRNSVSCFGSPKIRMLRIRPWTVQIDTVPSRPSSGICHDRQRASNGWAASRRNLICVANTRVRRCARLDHSSLLRGCHAARCRRRGFRRSGGACSGYRGEPYGWPRAEMGGNARRGRSGFRRH